MYDVSVVIATFRRPVALARALRSVAEQRNALGLSYEIVVVDNSTECSAQSTVERLSSEQPVPIRFVNEPEQNISRARNAGIGASTGSLVAFLDDDEEASADWLDHLVKTQRRFHADAVFGPVIPAFEESVPPAWESISSLYSRDNGLETGVVVSGGATGNVLIRVSCLPGGDPFDPAFGLTGGEDTDFFVRLARSGALFVWCAEAATTEFLPSSRCTQSYLLRRAFRSDQSFVRCCRKNSPYPMLAGAYWAFKGLMQASLLLLPVLVLSSSRSAATVRLRMKFVGALGKILSFPVFSYEFYADARNTQFERTL